MVIAQLACSGVFRRSTGMSNVLRRPALAALASSKIPISSSFSSSETIYALSSGAGKAGVAVIRVSGPHASEALSSICMPNSAFPAPRKAVVRKLRDPVSGEMLDESMVIWMPGPRSFTGEDTVELHTHGSRAVVSGVLEALGKLGGVRLAERGEFTQRAYGNGRLDLTEVEGLADLIAADTAAQRRQALRQMGGALGSLYDSWRSQLTKCLAHTEAVIDFGDEEEDVEERAQGSIRPRVLELLKQMRAHLDDGSRGEIVREGVRVAIVGPPNAGKSSLLNLLASRPAAIVSPQAGTTRDIVEVRMDLGGLPVILRDTAGVHDGAEDLVEQEGMRRAQAAAETAHLVIFVLDSSNPEEGLRTLADFRASRSHSSGHGDGDFLTVANKADIAQAPKGGGWWHLSCSTGEGVDALQEHLQEEVKQRFEVGGDLGGAAIDSPLITRQRHRTHVQRCCELLQTSLLPQLPMDLAAEDLRAAMTELGRITGAVDVEELLGVIFADFCIGK